MVVDFGLLMRSRLLFRCQTLVIDSMCMLCMMPEQTNSVRLVKHMEPNPGFIWWSDPIGRARFPQASQLSFAHPQNFVFLMRTSTARSNMYDNRPTETQYFYTDGDSTGKQLEGKNLYAITFSKGELPPINGFWSLTVYNKHHIFEANAMNRYSLGTKNQNLKFNSDGPSLFIQEQNLRVRTRSPIGYPRLKKSSHFISEVIGEKRQFLTAPGFHL